MWHPCAPQRDGSGGAAVGPSPGAFALCSIPEGSAVVQDGASEPAPYLGAGVGALLQLSLSGAGTLGRPQSRVVLVTEGEPVVMECPFHKHNGSGDYFDEFIWSHGNISRRILQFRMARPNASCVHRSEGHFSGTVDFERSVSFLNISEVLMNDTGPYLCYVKIGSSNSTEKVTHLLVRGESVSPAFSFLSLQHSTCASLSKRSPLLSSSGFPRPLGSVGQSSGKGPAPVEGKGEWFALQHLALQSSVLCSLWLVQRQQLLWAWCFSRAGGMQASKQL